MKSEIHNSILFKTSHRDGGGILVERPKFRAFGVIFWKKCKLRKVLSVSEILDYFACSHVRIFLINIIFGALRILILILSVFLFVMFVMILVERPELRAVGIIFWKKCKLRKVLSFPEILDYFAYSHVRVFLINILFGARRISILILSVVLFVMFVVILVERPEFRTVGVVFWKKM